MSVPPYDQYKKEQQFFLDCLQYFMGLGRSSEETSYDQIVVKDISVANAATLWKPGAATAALKARGISINMDNDARPGSGGGGRDKHGLALKRPAHQFQEEEEGGKRAKLNIYSKTDTSENGSFNNAEAGRSGLFSSIGNKGNKAFQPPCVRQNEEFNRVEQTTVPAFKTALDKLAEDHIRRKLNGQSSEPAVFNSNTRGVGLSKSALRKAQPVQPEPKSKKTDDDGPSYDNPELTELMTHEKLKGFEPKLVESILSEVMEDQHVTTWADIAGLSRPKDIIQEIVVWPMKRPDLFKGLRSAPKGILLFGPPGTGKTMIGRVIATESDSTFFNISASSLTSKWIGDGEKMVRCLFEVARIKQPSVIFIDEIDSILTQRSDTEHESSRRMKTEFLVQFDGCGTHQEDKLLVIGVTNRPQELDDAARRRLSKRIYIPLPDIEGRKQIVANLMRDQKHTLTEEEFVKAAQITEGYSGADMKAVCTEASLGPIREIGHRLADIAADDVRAISFEDFADAVLRVKSSVALKDLTVYENWNRDYGCQ